MKRIGLLYILLFFLGMPTDLFSEDFYSVGIERDLPERPITIMHYKDGEWRSEPFPPAMEFSSNSAPCLAISPEGELWMVWAARRDGEPPRIYFSRRAGINWSPPRPVSPGSDWEETPVIAFDRRGMPWIAWSRTRDDKTNIFCAGWKGGSFAEEEMVSLSITSPNINPSLGAGKNNTMALLWEGLDEAFYRIYFSIREFQAWSRERLLSPWEGVGQVLPSLVYQAGRMKGYWLENGAKITSDWRSGQWSQPYRERSKTALPAIPISDYRGWVTAAGTEEESIPLRIPLLHPHQDEKADRFPVSGKYYRTAAAHVYTGYGDSITYGTTPLGGNPVDYKGNCYIPLLMTLFEDEFPDDSFTIYNGGFPGATTHQLLEGGGSWGCPGIISAITQSQCSKILIMGGTNDVSDLIHPSETAQNLNTMINRARGLECEPILATIIPRCDSDSLNNDTTTLVTSYIIPLAKLRSCQLANPWQNYQNHPTWCNDYLAWWDGKHPLYPVGSQPIADAWYDAITVYTPSPTPSPTPLSIIIDSGDYNGDGTSDIALFRPSSGLWAIREITRIYFGSSSDTPASGDYNNDGITDVTVFRGSSGLWAVHGITRAYFGESSDLSAPGDYNGDGVCDIAVYRKSSGLWAVREITRCYFGSEEDIPVPGYYNGNRAKTIAIFRPSTGLWAYRGFTRFYFGSSGDQPVAADYAGNGSDQAGIFRSGNGLWAIRGYSRFYYGSSNDCPVPACYNGSMTESAIFRDRTGLWALRELSRVYYGTAGDLPVAGRLPQPITPTPTAPPSPTPSATPPPPSPTPSATPPPPATPTPSTTSTPVT